MYREWDGVGSSKRHRQPETHTVRNRQGTGRTTPPHTHTHTYLSQLPLLRFLLPLPPSHTKGHAPRRRHGAVSELSFPAPRAGGSRGLTILIGVKNPIISDRSSKVVQQTDIFYINLPGGKDGRITQTRPKGHKGSIPHCPFPHIEPKFRGGEGVQSARKVPKIVYFRAINLLQ